MATKGKKTQVKECRDTEGRTVGTITERIRGGEMKDSRYLLLIKDRMRDGDRGREIEREGGEGGG